MACRRLRLVAIGSLVLFAPLLMTCALTSRDTGTLHGYVRDAETFQPMAGAVVECESVWTETGIDGSYLLDGVTEGWRSLHAEAGGYSDYSDAVNVAGVTRYDIHMDAAVGVSHVFGVVSRPGQGPIEGALVDLDGRTKTTGVDGTYEFWNVPRDAERLIVSLNGYRTFSSPLYLDEDDEEINVTLLLLGTATLEAAYDATVREDIPATNLGYTPTLDLFNSPSWHFRFLIAFDLSGIPETAVADACTLWLTDTWEGGVEDPLPTVVSRAAAVWEEFEVTWANAPAMAGATYAGVSFTPPVYAIDVTGAVSDWLSGYADNHGIIIDTDESPTATRLSFASREHEQEDWRPRLVVRYAY